MVDKNVRDALLKELDRMPISLQRQVLSFASSLNRPRPKGTPVNSLLRFAGTISPEDGEAMMRAVDEGCEQVDPNGW